MGKPGRKEKVTVKQMERALRESMGLQSAAAKALGVGHTYVTTYLKRHPELRAVLHEITEQALDRAEFRLRDMIEHPEHRGHASATIFLLKTKGRHRGYSQHVQVTGAGGGPIEIATWSDMIREVNGDAARADTGDSDEPGAEVLH